MAKLYDDDRYWPIVDKHLPYFKDIYQKIKNAKTSDQANIEIEKLYRYIKEISPDFCVNNKMTSGYNYLAKRLAECEHKMPTDFIIDSKPNYKYGLMESLIPYETPIENQLDWIAYMTRKYLHCKFGTSTNFNNLPLTNKCKSASGKILELTKFLDLRCFRVRISPGFSKDADIYCGNGFHYINIIIYKDKTYLVDTTYRQFFTVAYNNLERLGIVGLSGCRPGVFMTMNEERKKVAEKILKDGWIELDDKTIKLYFDGLALSYRNGLFYQVTGDYSYTTNYYASDYKEFLSGLDSQVNREGLEVLGYQRTLHPKDNK